MGRSGIPSWLADAGTLWSLQDAASWQQEERPPLHRATDALKKAFSQSQVPEVLKVRAAAAFDGMLPIEQNRHRAMHGMALTLADDRLLFKKGWPEEDAFQRAFSLEQLSEVALDLGRINGELEQLLLDVYHPGRWDSSGEPGC